MGFEDKTVSGVRVSGVLWRDPPRHEVAEATGRPARGFRGGQELEEVLAFRLFHDDVVGLLRLEDLVHLPLLKFGYDSNL